MLCSYLHKLLRSTALKAAILGVVLVCFMRFSSYIRSGNVCSEFDLLLCFDTIRKIIAIFGALPFASNFSAEWNCGVTNMYITRCGVVKYAVANVLVTYFSAFICVLFGMLIYAGVTSCFMPFCEINAATLVQAYGFLLETDFAFLYIVLRAAVFASSCAMWSVMGLTLSAFFPNKYVAICTPFAASYIIERITIQFPAPFNLWTISISMLQWGDSLLMFLYSAGIFAALAAICGFVFTFKVKRMVQHGKC